jgi:hypothetical protein
MLENKLIITKFNNFGKIELRNMENPKLSSFRSNIYSSKLNLTSEPAISCR